MFSATAAAVKTLGRSTRYCKGFVQRRNSSFIGRSQSFSPRLMCPGVGNSLACGTDGARFFASSASPYSIVQHQDSDNHVDGVPESFAVVKLSGTQYKVTLNDVVTTHKIKGVRVGEKVEIDEVLLVGTRDQTTVGRPLIPGAKVIATVEEQTRDKKLIVFKKKRRKGYKKKQGHRSYITVLRVDDIVVG